MKTDNKKVLVTGGAGYIGSILVPQLLAAGYSVAVIDDFRYGQTSLLDVCHDPKLIVVRGDVRDEALMRTHLTGAEFVIPLACLVGASLCARDPLNARTINLDAIKLILDIRDKKQKILFPNTNSGYGRGQEGVSHCDETTPLEPISLYGKLKVEAEEMLLASENTAVFRLATVFGIAPRMRLDLLVNDFVYRAAVDHSLILFEPHFKRNFVHVRDVARAFMHTMEHFDAMKGEAYNVGLSEANLSKRELCEEIQKHIPKFVFIESPIGKDPDKRNYIVSNAKIEKTGFRARVSLSEGIKELIKGYQILKRDFFSNA